MNAQQYEMMRVLQKIPVFKGFEVQEAVRLLKICHSKLYPAGEVIYSIRDRSDEMLILLRGRLEVRGAADELLAEIGPGNATGEMGLFTGQPRSASIVAADRSACLIVRKTELIALLSHNKDMHIRLLYNLVHMLSDRLGQANKRNSELGSRLAELEEEDEEELLDVKDEDANGDEADADAEEDENGGDGGEDDEDEDD